MMDTTKDGRPGLVAIKSRSEKVERIVLMTFIT